MACCVCCGTVRASSCSGITCADGKRWTCCVDCFGGLAAAAGRISGVVVGCEEGAGVSVEEEGGEGVVGVLIVVAVWLLEPTGKSSIYITVACGTFGRKERKETNARP